MRKHAKNAAEAISHIEAGGVAIIPSYTRTIRIDQKTLARWADVPGNPLLRDDGRGIRMRTGRKSIYLFAGDMILV